jgi:hypothetical protein
MEQSKESNTAHEIEGEFFHFRLLDAQSTLSQLHSQAVFVTFCSGKK